MSKRRNILKKESKEQEFLTIPSTKSNTKLLKVVSASLVALMLINFVMLVFGKVKPGAFWTITAICAIGAFWGIPFIKKIK